MFLKCPARPALRQDRKALRSVPLLCAVEGPPFKEPIGFLTVSWLVQLHRHVCYALTNATHYAVQTRLEMLPRSQAAVR